jgi:hypothetical protein
MKYNVNNYHFTSDRPNLDLNKLPVEQRIFEEVPQQKQLIVRQPIPSGSDPMGQIYLQGHMLRSLANGKHPWWISLGAGLVFTSYAFFIFLACYSNHSANPIKPLVSQQKSR